MPALSQGLTFLVNNSSTVYVSYPNTATGTMVYTSDQAQGDGYFGSSDGLHTVMYTTTMDFVGTVSMQATLASEPVEGDWFNVANTAVSYNALNLRYFPSVDYTNFVGNFVWVRGIVSISAGAVESIQYNH
jgi:hypothetical protein